MPTIPTGTYRTVTYKEQLYNYDTLMQTFEVVQDAALATLDSDNWQNVRLIFETVSTLRREIQALPVAWHGAPV